MYNWVTVKSVSSLTDLVQTLHFIVLAALGLRCCTRAFFSCSKWELLFIVMHGLLIEVASLVAKHRLKAQGLQ